MSRHDDRLFITHCRPVFDPIEPANGGHEFWKVTEALSLSQSSNNLLDLNLYSIPTYTMASKGAALLIGKITHARKEWEQCATLLQLKVLLAIPESQCDVTDLFDHRNMEVVHEVNSCPNSSQTLAILPSYIEVMSRRA